MIIKEFMKFTDKSKILNYCDLLSEKYNKKIKITWI